MTHRGRARRIALAALASAGLLLAAQAQTIAVEPSPAQRCLTRGEVLLGQPEYPQKAYELKQGAKVNVTLRFAGRDTPPTIEDISAKEVMAFEPDFLASVKRFVEAYRVPCLPDGTADTLKQEFEFLPHDGRPVTLFASEGPADERRGRLTKCIQHVRPGTTPEYIYSDIRDERQGRVLLRMAFVDGQSPPRVEVLDNGGGGGLAVAASVFAKGYRLPCHDGGDPVTTTGLYIFRIEGMGQTILKDLPLRTLLVSFKGIRQANVYFDTTRMGCPFDLRFSPYQPHMRNKVGEVGTTNAERRFFMDWLSRQELELPKADANALLGQSALVHVPCTVIDLGSRQGGGGSK